MFLLFLLLRFYCRSFILVLESADLLSGCLLERLFHDFYRTYLTGLVYALVYLLQQGRFPFIKLFVDLVFTFLVPLDEVFLRSDKCYEAAVTLNDD